MAAIALVVASSTLLAGCSAASSTLTLRYERNGEARTVVVHPDSVSCSDRSVSGVARSVEPAGVFTIRMSGEPGEASATVSVTLSGDGDTKDLAVFETDSSAPTADSDSVTLAETSGAVTLIDNWDGDSDFDKSNGQQVDATLSADLRCDED